MNRVVVVGGGLAGITAAIRLADAGMAVTLCEARPRLGGATASFRRNGITVDTGQHVFLRCCSAYRGLLARLQVSGLASIQDRLDLPVVGPDGRVHHLRRGRAPAPLQLAGSLLHFAPLSMADRARLVPALAALRRIDPTDPAVDRLSFGQWLARHHQSPRAVARLWSLIGVPTLNAAPDRASLALAAFVFQTGLLGSPDAADLGIPSVALGELHGAPAAGALAAAGASVALSTKVRSLTRTGARWRVATDTGEHEADAVIVALPHQAAAALLPDLAGAGQWQRLGASPIVDCHVLYDRTVTELAFAAGVDSEVQWVFDRSRAAGLVGGQYLVVSLSAADRYVEEPVGVLRERFLPALAQLFPEARGARVEDFFVTRERRATFLAAPGTGALRPGAQTGAPGLFLAGAWTATGWPDTMEGAVRSGISGASSACEYLGGRRSTEAVLA
ncbi:MAG: hydroxysqualene dehydroxylase HpnE [Mycobacteriales bacterium]